jgi:hypothetical protein
LAWTVQHPAEQAEVALVFLGEIGTGKGTLGKAMCRIFGQHAPAFRAMLEARGIAADRVSLQRWGRLRGPG